MGEFGGVLLQVNVVELDRAHDRPLGLHLAISRVCPGIQGHFTADTERQVQLAGLVIFRHVGIEVVFAVPFGNRGHAAAEHQAGKHGSLDGKLIEHGQCAGHTQAGGAHVGIRFITEPGLARAEHLGGGLNLAVNFQTDGYQVIRYRHGNEWRSL